jgi:sterol desaturase/sphingolipid hydroxylase (fatty acid hydroxylase superfamily)
LACIVRGVVSHELGLWQTTVIGGIALLVWSLFEYITHRFLLHPPAKFRRMDRWAYFAHGKHHDESDHPVFALVPPLNAAIVLMPLLVIFYLVVPAHALAVFVGFFLLGYLAYEYVHLALHHASPKTRLGCYFRRHHLTHHAHGREGNFGVSSPLWDFLLGTTLRK